MKLTNRLIFCFFRCLRIIAVKQIRIIMNTNESAPARIIINSNGTVIVFAEFKLDDCLAKNEKNINSNGKRVCGHLNWNHSDVYFVHK